MASRLVVLVGPMGSGKSTVGRALAHRMGIGHIDTDDIVVDRLGRPIEEVFATDGEATFREAESAALSAALDGIDAVVSTGGGIVMAPDNRRALETSTAFVVWLDASVATLMRRVGDGAGRPVLTGDVRGALTATVEDRKPRYREVADLRIDTSNLSHSECVDEIVAALQDRDSQ